MMDAIIDLQIRLSYLEQTIDELNAVVTCQNQELAELQAKLRLIYQQATEDKQTVAAFDVLGDKPPHY